MKAELKAKFLQHLNQKKQDDGFTLIEMLSVMILIGILSALALPSFLNQAAKAQQSEAKTYVGAINRAQQAYRLESPSFAPDNIILQIGLQTQTVNYTYDITNSPTTALVNADSQDAGKLRSYAGGVVVITSGLTLAVACQTPGVSSTAPTINFSVTEVTCNPTDGEPMN